MVHFLGEGNKEEEGVKNSFFVIFSIAVARTWKIYT